MQSQAQRHSDFSSFVIAMLAFLLAGLLVYAAGMATLGCGAAKHAIPGIVKLVADDCVEIAKLHENGSVESICATARDLAPVLDAILGKRPVGGSGAYDGSGLVCVGDKCVTRNELSANYDLIKGSGTRSVIP